MNPVPRFVLAGVTVLARFDWRQMRMGRGEAETILATLFFTAQILWLERPGFAGNRTSHFSLVMFGVIGLMFLPVTLAATPSWPALVRAYDSGVVIGCTLGIIPAIIGLSVAKHVLVAILVMGLGVDAPHANR